MQVQISLVGSAAQPLNHSVNSLADYGNLLSVIIDRPTPTYSLPLPHPHSSLEIPIKNKTRVPTDLSRINTPIEISKLTGGFSQPLTKVNVNLNFYAYSSVKESVYRGRKHT